MNIFSQHLPGCIPANGGGGLMDSGGIFHLLFSRLGVQFPQSPITHKRVGSQ
jgi:hypothetical protein